MRKNPLNKGIIMENADGIGTVTPAMVEARARELARINGRDASKPTKADYQQAKHELTGEEDIDRQKENLESVPESTKRSTIKCVGHPRNSRNATSSNSDSPLDPAGLNKTGIALPASPMNRVSQNYLLFFNRTNASR